MAGLLDFLFQGQGGGLLGGVGMPPMQALPEQQPAAVSGLGGMLGSFGQDAMMRPGQSGLLGSLRGALDQIAHPDLQMQLLEQQRAQQAGMALLGALPGGNQPPQQPSSFGAIGPGASYSNAIAGIESKGQQNPYAAVGPDTGKGRAYGKYQVMDFNIPTWTKEVLGQEMTPQQFVASPEAQEAVFKAKFGQYVQKTGNPQDAASMWFTGKPLAEGANRSDVNGMTGQSYVNKFTQNLGQPAPTQLPPPGSPMTNQPGAGLQLVDSPALQGMPDTVRRAIPLMLQSKTMAPQAMSLIQKYINPDQWQMWRDNMGNVFTRNSATGESKPLLTPTPQMMNANASGLKSPLEYESQTALAGSAAKNTELTTEQKNARASGNLTPAQYEAQTKQANEAAQERGKAEGIAQSTLTNALTQSELALKNIEQIRTHPGKDALAGVGTLGWVPGIPGTAQKGFVTLVDQLKNKTFLQAYESLRGGGAITNVEGVKAESAIARLDRAQRPEDFNQALGDLEDVIKTGMKNARAKASGISVPSGNSQPDAGWQQVAPGIRIREKR